MTKDCANFPRLRDDKIALTEAQDAEEAHLRARYDTFANGPEQTARRRCTALQDAERRFKMGLLNRKLSRKAQNDLVLLRWLYPKKIDFTDRDQSEQERAGRLRYQRSSLPLRIAGFGRQFLSARLSTAATELDAVTTDRRLSDESPRRLLPAIIPWMPIRRPIQMQTSLKGGCAVQNNFNLSFSARRPVSG